MILFKLARVVLFNMLLRDGSRGFNSVPIYRINEEGKIKLLGKLTPVYPAGFVMEQVDNVNRYSEGLPWWLFDMRPQGYLGRAYAATYSAELDLPHNPDSWSDTDIIRALIAHGHDAVGNLLIGNRQKNIFGDADTCCGCSFNNLPNISSSG